MQGSGERAFPTEAARAPMSVKQEEVWSLGRKAESIMPGPPGSDGLLVCGALTLQTHLIHQLCLDRLTQAPLTYWPTSRGCCLLPTTQDTQHRFGMSNPNHHSPAIFREPHTFPLVAYRLPEPAVRRESFSSPPPPWGRGKLMPLSPPLLPPGRLQCSETLQNCLGESLRLCSLFSRSVSPQGVSPWEILCQPHCGPSFRSQVLLP